MYVSRETPTQINARLTSVLAQSNVRFYDEPYAFEEVPLESEPPDFGVGAIAVVRDDEVASRLVPSSDAELERFALFRFHFPPDVDNSGFVGWLATQMKMRLGTGVFVVCGQNTRRGGIFDYLGVPLELGPSVAREVECLRQVRG